MGFGNRWIRWISRCISVGPVSVLVSRSPDPKFNMKRGIRQGYPLSSLLFNIVAKTFLILVSQFQDKGWLEGIRIPGMVDRIIVL